MPGNKHDPDYRQDLIKADLRLLGQNPPPRDCVASAPFDKGVNLAVPGN